MASTSFGTSILSAVLPWTWQCDVINIQNLSVVQYIRETDLVPFWICFNSYSAAAYQEIVKKKEKQKIMLAGTSHKISARERDTAPRYYYKRTRTYTCCERIKNFFRAIFAFFFTQIGVSVVVALYMVLGAYMFSSLEAESQMECAVNASRQRWGKTNVKKQQSNI